MLTPMLLNELQKTHRSVVATDAAHKADQARIAALNNKITTQSAKIAALVSARKADLAEFAAFKQTQEKQAQELAKMTALMAALQTKEPAQKTADFVQP